MRVPDSSNPRYWQVGKRGRRSMPRRSSGRLRRLKVATAISRRCSTTIAAYPRVAIRCGRRCITSMVGPQMGRHRRRGFSGGRFPICSRVCCHRSTSCLCQGNVARLLRQVIEGAGCPALNGCSRIMKYMNDITTSEKLFRKSDYIFFTILTLLNFSAIVYLMIYWFSSNEWREHPVIFSIITLILSAVLVNSQGRWFVLLYMRRPKPMVARAGWKVAVVTTFVPGAEPLDMLEETVQALVALDYPHDTWVLDEGDEAQVKALCYALGAQHFSRKNFPHYHTAQ